MADRVADDGASATATCKLVLAYVAETLLVRRTGVRRSIRGVKHSSIRWVKQGWQMVADGCR